MPVSTTRETTETTLLLQKRKNTVKSIQELLLSRSVRDPRSKALGNPDCVVSDACALANVFGGGPEMKELNQEGHRRQVAVGVEEGLLGSPVLGEKIAETPEHNRETVGGKRVGEGQAIQACVHHGREDANEMLHQASLQECLAYRCRAGAEVCIR